MVILKVEYDNPVARYALIVREVYSRDQLKQKYRFACKYGYYHLARAYLYALHGHKGYFYEYERDRGTLYAYEYPPIKA